MKILVIPDCHLKPWMFDEAIEIKESNNVDDYTSHTCDFSRELDGI